MVGNEPIWPNPDGNSRMSKFDTMDGKDLENKEWPALSANHRTTERTTTGEWPQMAEEERMNKENNEWKRTETFGGEGEKRNEKMSWAQIINGQVTSREVEDFGKDFKLMIPGEGSLARAEGTDFLPRKEYLKDLYELVKCNEESQPKMKILHFKVVEVDEENEKINYTEGETAEFKTIKERAAMKLVIKILAIEWEAEMEGKDIFIVGDSMYVEFKKRINICEILKKKTKEGHPLPTIITREIEGRKWKISLEDSRLLGKAGNMKGITVVLKNAMKKIKIEQAEEWLKQFGDVLKINPKEEECPHSEIITNDETLSEKERKIMLDWLKEKKKMGPDIEVVMNLKTSLPMILPINDWGIETTHEDQVPQCSNCYKIGHFASRCAFEKIKFRTYSMYANGRWGSISEKTKIDEMRKMDTIRHKNTVTRLLNRGIKPENIRTTGQIDRNTAEVVLEKVKNEMKLRYQNRTNYHAKSEVFGRIRSKLDEVREMDMKDLTEQGTMVKTLLTDRRKKVGEMRDLKLPINLYEIEERFKESRIYITVRDLNTYKMDEKNIPMEIDNQKSDVRRN